MSPEETAEWLAFQRSIVIGCDPRVVELVAEHERLKRENAALRGKLRIFATVPDHLGSTTAADGKVVLVLPLTVIQDVRTLLGMPSSLVVDGIGL